MALAVRLETKPFLIYNFRMNSNFFEGFSLTRRWWISTVRAVDDPDDAICPMHESGIEECDSICLRPVIGFITAFG